ncbi:MAG TPA: outer membrane lipoprotein-sorting protein [Polyangiaceae bacterium]
MRVISWVVAAFFACAVAHADVTKPPAAGATASEIVRTIFETDPWGLTAASLTAHMILTDKNGSKSRLAFKTKARRIGANLHKVIARFSAPPELAGAGFLFVQKQDGDDDRFLFLPELKRARRISGKLRSTAFMGTDYSFADVDRRDLRESTATMKGQERIGKWECYVLDVVPRRDDSGYSHAEFWVRKDNYLPLRMKMYDRAQKLLKVFEASEVKRVSGRWFISKGRMINKQRNHTTELVLDEISFSEEHPEEDFSVRALERL